MAGTEISLFWALPRLALGPAQPRIYLVRKDFRQGHSSQCVHLTTDLHLVWKLVCEALLSFVW
jgi:hypothetical protein